MNKNLEICNKENNNIKQEKDNLQNDYKILSQDLNDTKINLTYCQNQIEISKINDNKLTSELNKCKINATNLANEYKNCYNSKNDINQYYLQCKTNLNDYINKYTVSSDSSGHQNRADMECLEIFILSGRATPQKKIFKTFYHIL